MQNQYGGRVIRLRYAGAIPPSPHYRPTVVETNYAELSLSDDTDEAVILQHLIRAGVLVRGFTVTKISLEDIFIRVYGDQNNPVDAPTLEGVK